MTVPLPDLFKRVTLAPGGVRINTLVGGNESGPPVLLLHGYPQTHVMWHHVAPILAQNHTVVLTDLRGYGDSGKPPGGATHDGSAKRTLARDQTLVMRDLGFEQFAVVGHDRGARVAHRLTLDYPHQRVDSYPSWGERDSLEQVGQGNGHGSLHPRNGSDIISPQPWPTGRRP